MVSVTGIQTSSTGNSSLPFLVENGEKQIISILLATENSFKTYSSQLFQVAQTSYQVREDAQWESLTRIRSFQISKSITVEVKRKL